MPDYSDDEWIEEMGQLILIHRGNEKNCWIATEKPLELEDWE